MPINVEELERKLQIISGQIKAIPNPGESGFRWWKPREAHVIRIVPHTPQFIELCYHYDINPSGPVICPNTFNKPCPICRMRVNLYKSGTKEDRALAKQLKNVWRFFAPIVVRESNKPESDIVPVWWTFSRTVYESIIGFCKDPDYGDISDPVHGTDLDIVLIKPKSDKEYAKTTVKPKRNSTVLASNDAQLKRIIEAVPDMMKEIKEQNAEQLEKILDAFLAGATTVHDATPESSTAVTDEKSVDEVFKELNM